MSLLDNIVSFWEMEETNTDARYDSVTAAGDLTRGAQNISYSTGVLGYALELTASMPNYVTSSNSQFQTGDVDFTFVTWVKLKGTTAYYGVFNKYTGTAATSDYGLYYYHDVGKYEWGVERGDQGGVIAVDSDVVSNPTTVWHMIACGHDAVNNEIWISINGAAPQTTGITQGVNASSTDFALGFNCGGAVDYMDGYIDQTGFWKSAPGAGGRLSAAAITWLYNGGAARTYSELSSYSEGVADIHTIDWQVA